MRDYALFYCFFCDRFSSSVNMDMDSHDHTSAPAYTEHIKQITGPDET